jgi:hypothetical protein
MIPEWNPRDFGRIETVWAETVLADFGARAARVGWRTRTGCTTGKMQWRFLVEISSWYTGFQRTRSARAPKPANAVSLAPRARCSGFRLAQRGGPSHRSLGRRAGRSLEEKRLRGHTLHKRASHPRRTQRIDGYGREARQAYKRHGTRSPAVQGYRVHFPPWHYLSSRSYVGTVRRNDIDRRLERAEGSHATPVWERRVMNGLRSEKQRNYLSNAARCEKWSGALAQHRASSLRFDEVIQRACPGRGQFS